jgi:flagellar motor protein MotB
MQPTDDQSRRKASSRRETRLVLVVALFLATTAVGCRQGAGRYPTWPWTPMTAPNGGAAAAPGSNAYVTELQRKADEQARLAAEQQQRLQQLQDLQKMNEDQMDAMKNSQLAVQAEAEKQRLQQEQELAARAREALGKYDELDRRAQGLDANNQDLHTSLARAQQQSQLLQDQNQLLRQRLEETNQRLAGALQATQDTEQRMQTLTASTKRRSGAAITANNSFRRNLTAVTVPGLSIRQDGEMVRIEMPSDSLFEFGTARLRPDATRMIDQVADVILQNYPRQVIGVEAHADNSPLNGTMWRSSHQLTAAQSMAVFEQLSYRHRLLPQQMFVLGHGENFPLSSNATTAGQARNRRVEVVVYPETVGQR